MEKLLIICGPTALGKTTLGLTLAKKLGGEIISADSRQVYKGMDIGTGKDLPKNAKKKLAGYYLIEGIRVWGYDLISPKKEYSVASYVKTSEKIIKAIWKRKKLPILVGGTGFYIEGIVDGIPTVSAPKNKNFRKSLQEKTVKELFDQLARLDPTRAASMNISDKKNPRRLIRAIEVALWKLKGGKENKKKKEKDTFFIGLTAKKEEIDKLIGKRVKKRIGQGFGKEMEGLLNKGVKLNSQSMQSLGYRQWGEFISGKKTKDEVIENWIREEVKYAKRQMVWFKKDKRIYWFDVKEKDYKEKIAKQAEKWYKMSQ